MMKKFIFLVFMVLSYSIFAEQVAIFLEVNKFNLAKDYYLLSIIHIKENPKGTYSQQEDKFLKRLRKYINSYKKADKNIDSDDKKYFSKISKDTYFLNACDFINGPVDLQQELILIKIGATAIGYSNNEPAVPDNLNNYNSRLLISMSRHKDTSLGLSYDYTFNSKNYIDKKGRKIYSEQRRASDIFDFQFDTLEFLGFFPVMHKEDDL